MTHRSKLAAKAKSLVGRSVALKMKDGSTVSGALVRISGDRLYVSTAASVAGGTRKSGSVRTKALLPLLLFDVAAIGAGPYGGGYGGYGGFGPYGAYGSPYGPYGPYGGAGGFWF